MMRVKENKRKEERKIKEIARFWERFIKGSKKR